MNDVLECTVSAQVDHTTAGPLANGCPACGVGIGAACIIWTPPVSGDVRGLHLVRTQIEEFHESRVKGHKHE